MRRPGIIPTVPAAIALLVVSGCSSSGTIGSSKGSADGGFTSPPARSNPLVGTWTGTGSDGATVSLVVTPDGKATLISPHACTGTAKPHSTILLDCADGNTDRTNGAPTISGKTLSISWDIGINDTLQKTG